MLLSSSSKFSRISRINKPNFERTFLSSCHLRYQPTLTQGKHINNFGSQQRCSSSTPFIMADIGEGISEVEVLQWYVKEGDMVEQFTPLCEVQSDKATVPISSRYEGKVVKIYYPTGTIAKVGTPLCDIETSGSVDNVDIVPSQSTQSNSESTQQPQQQQQNQQGKEEIAQSNAKVLASPATRYLAKKENINLSQIKGTGKGGMITKADLLDFINGKTAPIESSQPIQSKKSTSEPLPDTSIPSQPSFKSHPIPVIATEDEVVILKGFKKAMAVTMNESLTIPHFGYCDEIDVTNLVSVREKLRKTAKSQGVSLSFLPFFIKAASLAMLSYPEINSTISKDLKYITKLASHNIAIAIATPTGLVVPNIKNVQKLSIHEIAVEIQRIISLANSNKLSSNDLTGSTFTLSNIGSLGGTYASPVLVSPQVVIGALGKVQKLPRFDEEGNVTAAQIMQVSWSGDHRVVDGATIALFSNLFKDFLENPALMMLYLH